MRMRGKYIFLSGFILLIIGYLLGAYFPPNVDIGKLSPMSKGEYYGNIINGFVAFGTCSAVIVALFIEEIRATFKKVIFNIRLGNDVALEDIENIKGTKKAKRYYNSVQIFNNGNINAQNCELYLEQALFISGNTTLSLSVESTPISWNSGNSIVYIPCQGKKVLPLFEIIAPQKQSTPDGKTDIVPAQMYILGMKQVESKAGKWELVYCLYSINSKPQKFKYTIEWNGNWEDRQTEMKDILNMKLEMI